MYALLAIPFGSYVEPLIIMAAVPFGIVGAVFAHLILGLDLGLLSIFGIVGLSGVVVNDALVLIDFVNAEYRSGKPMDDRVCRNHRVSRRALSQIGVIGARRRRLLMGLRGGCEYQRSRLVPQFPRPSVLGDAEEYLRDTR